MTHLPADLYTSQGIRQLDLLAGQQPQQNAYVLMSRAGLSAFTLSKKLWPTMKKIAIFCGTGNNGGDGFIFARLAFEQGFEVIVYQVGEVNETTLSAAAKQAREEWQSLSQPISTLDSLTWDIDLIVDAILGTGVREPLDQTYQQIIQEINTNAQKIPVLAIDLPSGINSNTGSVIDCAINADATISFLGMKVGLVLGAAYDHVGQLFFDDLGVEKSIFQQVNRVAKSYTYPDILSLLPKLKPTVHKGNKGHVLVVGGGEPHYIGAPLLSAEAAYRAGAGRVSVFMAPQSGQTVARAPAEIMVYASDDLSVLERLIENADAVLVGPGLGNGLWATRVFEILLTCSKRMVVDADALNQLSSHSLQSYDWVLTPHPGEAARLLGQSVHDIQANRLQAAQQLAQQYKGTIVLKGVGTIICAEDAVPAIYAQAVPSLATAGTGDILAGIIASFLAQGMPTWDAAKVAVAIHGQAGMKEKLPGMIASDLFQHIRLLLSQVEHNE